MKQDDTKHSLISLNLGKLPEALVTMLGKLLDVWQMERKPTMTVKQALADAEAKAIGNLSDAQLFAMSPVLLRMAKREQREYENRQRVIEKALERGWNRNSGTFGIFAGQVEEDWLEEFARYSGRVSDDSLTEIWGALLANEVEAPGCVPKRVIYTLDQLSRQEALAFSILCNYRTRLDGRPKIMVPTNRISTKGKLGFNRDHSLDGNVLVNLEATGLVKYDPKGMSTGLSVNRKYIVQYGEWQCDVIKDKGKNNPPLGCIALTAAGEVISNLIEPEYSAEYLEFFKRWWVDYLR